MNHSEQCALKLLKLVASPRKTSSISQFIGYLDADGNTYSKLFKSLDKQGLIKFNGHAMEVLT